MAALRVSQWSYAQYAMFRRLLGACLLAHCLALIPKGAESFARATGQAGAPLHPLLALVPSILDAYAEPWAVQLLIAVAVLAAVLLTLGRADRAAALVLGYVLACLHVRDPAAASATLVVVGLLLLHAALPKPEARSLARLAAWSVPRSYLVAAWVVLASSYSYGGWTKLRTAAWRGGDAVRIVLEDPLVADRSVGAWLSSWPDWSLEVLTWSVLYAELLFAPLVLLPRLRPLLWGIMLGGQIGLAVLTGSAARMMPMGLLHLFTVEQRWLFRFERKVPATVYYDGHCALCHRLVRFALVEDRRKRLTFAPLQSDTAVAYLGDDRYLRRTDTVVVRTTDGETHERSDAAVEILYRLGGAWAVLGALAGLVPRGLRDRAYDFLGAHRSRFGKTGELCPDVPPELAARLLSASRASVDREGVDRDTAC